MPRSKGRAKVAARLCKERRDYCIERRDLRQRARKTDADRQAVQIVVNRLTNWQRNQWARAKYPGLRERNPKKVEPFAGLVRAFGGRT